MGVTGLWKLIDASGKPVPIETLENKVLAIDISIWLHQVVKGFQDNKGSQLSNAHLLGLFHRLCKLLYYRIKPVFVFDGGVPQLKRETIAKRNQSRNKLLDEANRVENLILQALAKEKVVQQALGPNATALLTSPVKPQKPVEKPEKDDMFKLPELPEDANGASSSTADPSFTDIESTSETESSFEEGSLRHSYSVNLQSIDVTSAHFKNLPADVRHEILTDIRETRKQSSWGRLHELPAQSNEFSSFQMKRLLKRRQVQVSLEEAEQEMGGTSLSFRELQSLLSEEGVIPDSAIAKANRIASDENTRFILVRNLKKAYEQASKEEETKKELVTIKEESDVKQETSETPGKEYDVDLQKAIEMSLKSDGVYDDADYEDGDVKMNRQQREQLKSTVSTLARAYMIEYGGMNDDDIKNLLDQTQLEENDMELSACTPFKHNDKFILKGEMITPYKNMVDKFKEIQKRNLRDSTTTQVENNSPKNNVRTMSDSDSDSDFVDVPETDSTKNNDTRKKTNSQSMEIFLNLDKEMNSNDDDMFADIFIPNTDSVKVVTQEACEESKETKSDEDVKSDGKSQPEIEDVVEISSSIENSGALKGNKSEEIVEIPSSGEELKENISAQKASTSNFVENCIEIPSSSESAIEEPEKILSKLKADLEKVSVITLDEISVPAVVLVLSDDESKISEDKQVTNETPIDPGNIVADLKKQIAEVSKISLDEIEVSPEMSPKSGQRAEVIEILDESIQNSSSKAKKTPEGKIDEFFEKKFLIKRTPEKVKEEIEIVPKVKSPFFVIKTPKTRSSEKERKRKAVLDDDEDEDVTPRKDRRVAKTLFKESGEETSQDVRPLDAEPVNVVEIAAKTLRENKSRKELEEIAGEIAKERRDLEVEKNRQGRMGTSITDKMSDDCMNLLRLFGMPYIVAPMEAEAQCAFLDVTSLTDGTITDDSDIWLFGGQTVYKNFFNDKKHVMEFNLDNIEKLYNMDRSKLIQLAILVGSDYTTGITGIGAVTALEILSAFSRTPIKDGETSETMSVLSSLRKFRDWWRNSRNCGQLARSALRSKLKNIELNDGFPNSNIVEAYLNPKVDDNKEKFRWGTPDVETIREFTKKTFGWTKIKTDEILNPVLKKMNEKKSQSSIKNYFTIKSALSTKELKVSKRVQKAIHKMSADYKSDEEEPIVKKPRKRVKKAESAINNEETAKGPIAPTEKPKRQRGKRAAKSKVGEPAFSTVQGALETEIHDKPEAKQGNSIKRVIPINTKEKDMEEMEKRKELAAQLFKRSREANKPKQSA